MTDATGSAGPAGGRDQPAERSPRRDVRLVVMGVFAVLLVWFAVANLHGVRIRFWLTSATAPLFVVIVIAGVLGAAVSALVGRTSRRRRAGDERSRSRM